MKQKKPFWTTLTTIQLSILGVLSTPSNAANSISETPNYGHMDPLALYALASSRGIGHCSASDWDDHTSIVYIYNQLALESNSRNIDQANRKSGAYIKKLIAQGACDGNATKNDYLKMDSGAVFAIAEGPGIRKCSGSEMSDQSGNSNNSIYYIYLDNQLVRKFMGKDSKKAGDFMKNFIAGDNCLLD